MVGARGRGLPPQMWGMSLMPQSHINHWREYASERGNISLDEAELISLPQPVRVDAKQRRNRRGRT